MKKIILSASLLFSFLATSNAIAQQGFGTNQPNKSAAVDIVSSKRGLLIPRVALIKTTDAAPVATPANSLLVYNTAISGDVTPGFYYWETNQWVRFISATTEKTVTVSQGENVAVSATTDAGTNTTNYEVSIKGGDANGKVLVTKIDGAVTTTEWVDPSVFVDGVINADNGLNKGSGNTIKLGGALTETTTIATENFDLSISGLNDVAFVNRTHSIVVMEADGTLKVSTSKSMIDDAIAKGDLVAKTLKGSGITVTAGTTEGTGAEVQSSLLKDVVLGIANDAITSDKIKDGEVKAADLGADPADEGKVATVNADGTVSYKDVSSTLGKNITTDGKIVIGSGETSVLENAVLVETALKIKAGSIEAGDMADAGFNNVLVTDVNGNVVWVDQSTIKSNDTFEGTAPITIAEEVIAQTGGIKRTIGVNTAAGVGAGIAKEADTNPTINFVDGVATVNVDNISATQGKALTSTSITVTNGAQALLADTSMEITPGTEGQVLVTKQNADPLTGFTTTWIDATALGNTTTAENGLTKTDNNIQLGGTLIKPTTIATEATNTLAISGLLVPVAEEAQIVMAEATTGVLRNVARSLEYSASANFVVATQTGYNKFVPEITIAATIGGSDLSITLPNAVVAKGQVINVKIQNTTEPDYYVNIAGVDGTTIYGSMPFQGWILKSNGTSWSVVGRN